MTIPIAFKDRDVATVEEFQLQVESRVQEMQHCYSSARDLWTGDPLPLALVLSIQEEHRLTELAQHSRRIAEKAG